VLHETASALDEITEGWIALLRLVTLSLHSAADHATFIEQLRSFPDKYVSGFLVEEILSQQSPAVQALLLRISILDQFCADLCVAIMGSDTTREQVQATLDWLEYSNMFLIPLGDLQGWFRLHHLFRVLLRQRMFEHSSAEELDILNHRASAWYAERGFIEEALRHALEAGDMPYAARLVEAQFLPMRERERWMLMERLLHLLPEELIQSSPALLCARAYGFCKHADCTQTFLAY
jgi:LuxR family maltose regulon positive regulatory protein